MHNTSGASAEMLFWREFQQLAGGIVFVYYAHWWISFYLHTTYFFLNHYELRKSMIIFAGG